jgi:hypothetical protein
LGILLNRQSASGGGEWQGGIVCLEFHGLRDGLLWLHPGLLLWLLRLLLSWLIELLYWLLLLLRLLGLQLRSWLMLRCLHDGFN